MKLRWPVVLFDLDGTLANSIDLVVESYAQAFAAVTGRVIRPAEAKRWIGETLEQTFRREDAPHTLALDTAYRAWFETRVDQISGYPGIASLLVDLRAAGATLGVVTAKRRAAAIATMRSAGVLDLIDIVGALEDTSAHKPDPAPLLAAAATLGASPSQCVYVGDAVHDVQAAQAAGMTAIAVTWGAGVPAELAALSPDALCDNAATLRFVLLLPT